MYKQDDWQMGFDLGANDGSACSMFRHFGADESQDFINGYSQGFASAAWEAAQDLEGASEDYFTPAEYRRGSRFDTVSMWDEASSVDDGFYATQSEWRAMGS